MDEDCDGLVDEGVLALTINDGMTNELRVVLCSGVSELLEGESENGLDDNGNQVIDELGFNVHRVDDVLRLQLSLQAASESGNVLTRTLETTIRIRN